MHPKTTNLLDKIQWLILGFCTSCYLLALVALWFTSLSGYWVAFIGIVLGLGLIYVLVASRSQQAYQLNMMTNLVESMIEGDYSLRSRLDERHAFYHVYHRLNVLSASLSQHKTDAKESQLLLEKFIEQMDAMVIATTMEGRVVMANQSATKHILDGQTLTSDTSLAQFPRGALLLQQQGQVMQFDKALPGEYLLLTEHFMANGKPHRIYIISNADRMLMEQERKSWQGLLRVLSHELNNSLTPIMTISQQIKKRLAQEPQASSSYACGVDIIYERASALSRFIGSYSQLTHLPTPNKQVIGLGQQLSAAAHLFPKLDCRIHMDNELDILVDPDQFTQVLVNIFKNASEACDNVKNPMLNIFVQSDDSWLILLFQDNGGGIANPSNLFVPFYSTKENGSGIGLALCRQILFNHGGLISLENNPNGVGAVIELKLPCTSLNIK